ncbi:MAG: fructosamine kinase family protein [Chromatiaceae bacterium]
MTDWNKIAAHIQALTGQPCQPGAIQELGGGCINRAYVLRHGASAWFVKINDAQRRAMFQAEAAGLEALAAARAIRVPTPLGAGRAGEEAFLVLEYLAFGPPRREGGAEAGWRLAHLHRQSQARFGWDRDNFIGSTPQANGEERDWATFWQARRLGPQLDLALAQGFGGRLQDRGRRLWEACPALIDHGPRPSLLHGDLWSGNLAFDAEGQPVLFDPAVYYGDREADLAMTELFGGFGADFQAAYREAWPLDPGYKIRRDLYNLYHILNHLNLFGAGYLGQALGMIDRLLAVLH